MADLSAGEQAAMKAAKTDGIWVASKVVEKGAYSVALRVHVEVEMTVLITAV